MGINLTKSQSKTLSERTNQWKTCEVWYDFCWKKKENVGGENSSEIKHLPHKSNSEFGSPDTYLDSLPAYLALEGGAGIPRY